MFDTAQKRIVAFGGYDGRSLADVRVLEQETWQTLGRHPSMAAAEPGFVYDARRNLFVAFGGSAGRGQTTGTTWSSTGPPGPRWRPSCWRMTRRGTASCCSAAGRVAPTAT